MKKNLLMGAAQVLTALLLLGSTAAFAGPKVEVCHVPQGNPGNFHTIKVSENALSAHLGHGDIAGPCDAACATLCDDGNACTIDDTGDCELNGCPVTPEAVDCKDGNQCTEDLLCDVMDGCLNVPQVNLSCDDGQVCSGPDVCSAEGICGGPAVDNCCVSDAQCSQDFCDQESCNLLNQCGGEAVQCETADLCQVSVCSNIDEACSAPTPVSCADGESCNPDTGACEIDNATCPCWTPEVLTRVPQGSRPAVCRNSDFQTSMLSPANTNPSYTVRVTDFLGNRSCSLHGGGLSYPDNISVSGLTPAEYNSCVVLLVAECDARNADWL